MLLTLKTEDGAVSQWRWLPLEAKSGLQFTAGKEVGTSAPSLRGNESLPCAQRRTWHLQASNLKEQEMGSALEPPERHAVFLTP